ncbi:MAG TPA: PPOX class F420-dependent oxidoreductase [Gaiellaceae bacterium]|nr:PPOX class F420-dependent oxidoreductase [Gaiellaceae bacterium]
MPRVPVPPEVDEFLARPNPAVVGTIRRDGSPHTAATWYDWEDGRVLLNMDASRLRLGYLRRDPRASLTVLDGDSWYRQITLLGRVTSIEDDPALADIDRLALRYTGKPYRDRSRNSVSAWLEPAQWYGWAGGRHVTR